MIFARAILSPARLAAATLLAASTLSFFAGCKGNMTSAAIPERAVGTPPSVLAYSTTTDLRTADPLSTPAWRNASWLYHEVREILSSHVL